MSNSKMLYLSIKFRMSNLKNRLTVITTSINNRIIYERNG